MSLGTKLKIGITRFLGTNCDEDVRKWLQSLSADTTYLWFEDQFDVNHYDMIVLPGGFSHGDYLRCGAMAAQTPVMKSVKEFAKKDKPILGICNGFQILCEAGLLPGALLRNKELRFKDQWVQLQVNNNQNPFAKKTEVGQTLKLPIAHGDGNYYADSETLKKLKDNNQIWLTYKDNNPNGALMDIAGITNEKHNICALMPHPERALYEWMGSCDGAFLL
ncbi:MAG: phosphoribosylformylglycinamidine synthase subunit PurQ [Bdellovibrionaceae bacterium]|nr:phosphoribosylformylglycinamidine synthase subunit PurQ [Bdellovibrio sp.]